jgi:glycosyltransferase involved in cell wall biosynthesis
VTLLDALVWTDPDTVAGRSLGWHRAMIKRAERHADALVVPSHAVAEAVAEHGAFGDRVRVIPQAPAEDLAIPKDALERLRRLGLPGAYALTFATANPRHQLSELLRAIEPLDVPLAIAGSDDPGVDALLGETRMPAERVLRLGRLDREDLAAVQAGASVFVQPSRDEGFALGMLEAFVLGTPVVSSDASAFVEVAADAALTIERGPRFAEGLRDAVEAVLGDEALADRLRVAGRDRARAFTWRDAADKVWQLHADL